jgi:hypothetical protein
MSIQKRIRERFSNGKHSPASIGRRMGDSVTIQLKTARGHPPVLITEKQ